MLLVLASFGRVAACRRELPELQPPMGESNDEAAPAELRAFLETLPWKGSKEGILQVALETFHANGVEARLARAAQLES